jgi:hypothetical protein
MSVEGIPEVVRRSMRILATHRALFGSRRTTGRTLGESDINRVVSVFEIHGAAWALVGAHDAILRDLDEAFGDLGAQDRGAMVRLGAIDVDLIRSSSHPLCEEALRQVLRVGEWRVARTEVLIALTFLAASRRQDRVRRGNDIVHIFSICHRLDAGQLDRETAIRLGGLAYPGAETELRELLDKIDRGEPLAI